MLTIRTIYYKYLYKVSKKAIKIFSSYRNFYIYKVINIFSYSKRFIVI